MKYGKTKPEYNGSYCVTDIDIGDFINAMSVLYHKGHFILGAEFSEMSQYEMYPDVGTEVGMCRTIKPMVSHHLRKSREKIILKRLTFTRNFPVRKRKMSTRSWRERMYTAAITMVWLSTSTWRRTTTPTLPPRAWESSWLSIITGTSPSSTLGGSSWR